MEKIKKIKLVTIPILLLSITFLLIWTNKKETESVYEISEKQEVIEIENKANIPTYLTIVAATDVVETIPFKNDVNIALLKHKLYARVGLALVTNEGEFIAWLPGAELLPKYEGNDSYHINAPGDVLDWWLFEDLNNDGIKELAVEFAIAGSSVTHPFYLYSYIDNKFKLMLLTTYTSSKTEIKDLDNDGNKEIVQDYSVYGLGGFERAVLRWVDVLQVQQNSVVKVNSKFPVFYPELIKRYDEALPDLDARRYLRLMLCLKQKANLVMQGTEADATECEVLHL